MGAPDVKVIEQAALWMTTFQSGEATPADEVACAHWRAAHPEHETAWEMINAVNLRIRDGMKGITPAVARHTLDMAGKQRATRRDAMKSLAGVGAVALLGAGGWLMSEPGRYDRLAADRSTGPGERRAIELPDGTIVTLNTASAIDIAYDASTRVVRLLSGEIDVRTAKDSLNRPLHVATRFGDIVPHGTRFVVRDVAPSGSNRAESISVAVTEGAVSIAPVAGTNAAVLAAGQQASFTATSVGATETLDSASRSWLDGMLLARRMPLPDFIAELARYRRGVLRCDPALASVSVSGAFPLDDTDAALALLEKAVPVRARTITPYWVTVLPR